MDLKQNNNTAIGDFFAWIRDTVSKDSALYTAAEQYLAQAPRDFSCGADGPFLSIVMRTQGKRPEMLGEVLLCLCGQSNTDFELLLMGHNLEEAQRETVERILSEQPEMLRRKTRLIPVTGGTRTTPLNRGFEEARGRYIAVLDDDDLVFENWVEAFYELYREHDGNILHTWAVAQDWQIVGKVLPDTPCAAGTPDDCYCVNFDYLDQLAMNACPLCTLAFPAYLFHRLGIRFNEELNTTEDWDYLMRVAFLAGVADSQKITFLYRLWTNAESSATLHTRAEWNRTHRALIRQFTETPILMPRKSLKNFVEKKAIRKGLKGVTCLRTMRMEAELYYDTGTGISAAQVLHPDLSNDCEEECTVCFTASDEIGSRIRALRFDPCERGMITMLGLRIEVVEQNGITTVYERGDVKTNGVSLDGHEVFILDDPQIWIKFGSPKDIAAVRVYCYFEPTVSQSDRMTLMLRKKGIVYRMLRKMKRVCKRVLGK